MSRTLDYIEEDDWKGVVLPKPLQGWRTGEIKDSTSDLTLKLFMSYRIFRRNTMGLSFFVTLSPKTRLPPQPRRKMTPRFLPIKGFVSHKLGQTWYVKDRRSGTNTRGKGKASSGYYRVYKEHWYFGWWLWRRSWGWRWQRRVGLGEDFVSDPKL